LNTLEKLCDEYMIRNSPTQKERFLQFIQNICNETGWTSRLEQIGFSKNLLIGDLKSAKIVLAAHYDTPIRSLFPSTLYPHSKRRTRLSMYWPIPVFLFSFVLLSFLLEFSVFQIMIRAAYVLFLLFVCIRLWVGPANEENMNENTSGVAVLLLLLQALNKATRKKVAFVLFDHGAQSPAGSKKFFRNHKNEFQEKFLVDLDCVGLGDMFFVFPGKGDASLKLSRELSVSIKKQAIKADKTCMTITKSADICHNCASAFPTSAEICAVQPTGKFSEGVKYRGTAKDRKWDEANLHILVQSLRGFIESHT